jgi:hypothetical protein
VLHTILRVVISMAVTAGVGYLDWTLLRAYREQHYSLWWTAPGWLLAIATLAVATSDDGVLIALPASLVFFFIGAGPYFSSRECAR